MDKLHKLRWLLLILAVILTVFLLLQIHRITPEEITRGRMLYLEYRIGAYVAEHHAYPNALTDLPQRGGRYDDLIVDGWGREIIYRRNGSEITLASYGKNGPGGGNQDKGMKYRFVLELQPNNK
jgi:hypothetical protein